MTLYITPILSPLPYLFFVPRLEASLQLFARAPRFSDPEFWDKGVVCLILEGLVRIFACLQPGQDGFSRRVLSGPYRDC